MQPLLRELAELEIAIDEPLVPGEIAGWCAAVERQLRHFEQIWTKELVAYEEGLEQIADDDPALQHRIGTLRERRAHLLHLCRSLHKKVKSLASDAETASGSWEPHERAEAVQDELGVFARDCRRLDLSIATWSSEAQYRDVGAAD